MDILIVGLQYVSVMFSFVFITFVAYQKKSALCSHLLLYSIAVLLNGLSYLFELRSDTVEEAMMAIRFEYFGLCTATVAALLFICELFHVKMKKWVRSIVVLAFFASCILVVTNKYHHLHYESASLELREHIAVFRMVPGPHYTSHTIITLVSMGICIGVIIYAYIRDVKRKENYKKYMFLGLAALIPLLFWVLRLVGSLRDYDLIPFGLFCSNACFILILYFFRIFDVAENAKNDVLDTMEEGILVCDEEGHFVYQNQKMHEIFCGKELKNISDVLCELIPTEEGEFQIGERYYAVTESEVYEGEKVTGKTWCFIDMTQTKERERQLKELHQMAMAANNAKSNFLANMSHEIRTPINTILGMDELILREAQNLNVLEYAQNIKKEGKTLMSLINDLLDFSKIESGKMELAEVSYETQALIHDVVAMFSIKTEEKGLEFEVDIASDVPAVLYGDELRLKQILNNLLSNAVKYTERGFVKLALEWNLRDEKTAVLDIRVRDSGIGIQKDNVKEIFEKFKRFDSVRNSRIEGTGLGMSITAQLLQLMDGEIFVESEYGIGSEFRVKIPQMIMDATPIGEYTYEKQEPVKETFRVTFTAPDAKVLVVDDNVMNRVVVKGLLKHTLMQIEEADGGAECLKLTQNNHYDVILLDHMMPGMDGVETLQRLRSQNGTCAGTPVIVLTANAVMGVKDFYMEKGFDDYMSKPISGTGLERMLLKYLPEELVLKRRVDEKQLMWEQTGQHKFRSEEIRNVLSMERISFTEGMEQMEGDKEMYRKTARLFASLREERLRMLHEYIRTEDVPDYTILVHAIKADAKLLGAKELAEMAWEQEKMGKEGNLSFIIDKFGLLSAEYQRVAECFERLFNSETTEGGE
ncbi:MAG: response regulator [Lachnospiraceae bacterium]|nr:response regulator [Lachnospiraceae bacterium]